jgi:hypothetical protein
MIWLVGRLATGVRGTERITSGEVVAAGVGAGAGAFWEAEASSGLGIAIGSAGAICAGLSVEAGGVTEIADAGSGCAALGVGVDPAGTDSVPAEGGIASPTCAAAGTVWFVREVKLLVLVHPGRTSPQAMARDTPKTRELAGEDCMTGEPVDVLAVSRGKSIPAPGRGNSNTIV